MEEAWCTCGHLLDEHADGFLQECEVESCECICYEYDVEVANETDDEDEDAIE